MQVVGCEFKVRPRLKTFSCLIIRLHAISFKNEASNTYTACTTLPAQRAEVKEGNH
jgi:hypothetical protein